MAQDGGVSSETRRGNAHEWSGLPEARREAGARGDHSVGSQHLLLALLGRSEGEAQRVLRRAGVSRAQFEAALRGFQGQAGPPTQVDPDDVDVSERARVLIDRAVHLEPSGEATDEALLAALLDDDDPGVAKAVLNYLGVGREWARGLVDELHRRA